MKHATRLWARITPGCLGHAGVLHAPKRGMSGNQPPLASTPAARATKPTVHRHLNRSIILSFKRSKITTSHEQTALLSQRGDGRSALQEQCS